MSRLMTLHSAKGLEFDTCLSRRPGGRLATAQPLDWSNDDDVEEERRLCYVGMTRAKKSLTCRARSFAVSYGEERLRSSAPSRFLREIPGELIETSPDRSRKQAKRGRYEPDPDYYQSTA